MKLACALLLIGTLQAEQSLEIGGSYSHANIKVLDHPSFSGNLGGVQANYQLWLDNHFYGSLDLVWKGGNTSGSRYERVFSYIDAQEKLGYTFSCFTLFSGFGYRYLNHKLKSPSIRFEYNEFYIPIGFLSEYQVSCDYTVGLNFTWMPQVDSTVLISPLKGARWVLQNRINNYLVELPLTYFFNCFSLIFKPFFQSWEDGRSTAVNSEGDSLGLPGNRYTFLGFELNFALCF